MAIGFLSSVAIVNIAIVNIAAMNIHIQGDMDIKFCFPWVNTLDTEWLGIYFTFKETTSFPKWVYHITSLPAVYESYSCYTSSTIGAGSF